MKGARWEKLAAELKDEGAESPYLDQLRARFDPEQAFKELENELAGEVARALGRTEEQLLIALAELDLCEARWLRLTREPASASARDEAAHAFNAQRARAEQRRRHLIIHREAAGFRRNQVIYELYPIPAQKPLTRS